MTAKKVQKRGASRKGEGVTAERIRTILSDPSTDERGKARIRKLVGELYQAGEWDTLPETPEYFGLLFEQTYINDHLARGTAEPDERELYGKLADAIDRHEPKAYKVARRCVEIYDDWLGRKKGRKYPDGATYFAEHVDAVLEGGDDGLIPNPDSKYFPSLFVEAWSDRGPRDRKVRALLDLIRRVDEGADLNALYDEDRRAQAAHAESRVRKDDRLVRRLSEVVADEKREDDRIAISDILNSLANHSIGVSDFHPEIFPTLARVTIREARKCARGRSKDAQWLRRYFRDLEAIAAEKGGE